MEISKPILFLILSIYFPFFEKWLIVNTLLHKKNIFENDYGDWSCICYESNKR